MHPFRAAWLVDARGTATLDTKGMCEGDLATLGTRSWVDEVTEELQQVVGEIGARPDTHKFQREDFETLRSAVGRGMYGER